ncbi:hypothetical protein KHA94_22320 [Bacillus sp. FJAT-49705]|uniref:Uncharacterized protein n=1 Tax=Cytobacillus citreus TaxID=2833586 RepID=A0ABS5NYF4_9BACI|nr:hypothetical protein [Cytobacillus citreus]MBS4192868.1 hypothetical protein [Cytobacillus citreus]
MPIQDEKDEKRLNADIPKDLHRKISILPAKKGVRLKALVIDFCYFLILYQICKFFVCYDEIRKRKAVPSQLNIYPFYF